MSRGKRKADTLTQALAKLLKDELLPDLEARAKTPSVAQALARRWQHERERKRTAEKLDDWVEQALEQVGAAWILSCVFLRTLEDRGLVEQRRLAGEGAADSEQYFFELAPELGVRDYLLSVFQEIGELPGAEELLGPQKNPAWRLSPSEEGARRLLEFFREAGEGGAGLRWSFGGEDSRFLGDLYQDLSAAVRERYALLQTPDFVEKFILSLTLDPALKEFGLEGLRVIDPTCGSGHFLLGAYDRLFEARCAAAPGGERRAHAQAALEQVYGVDVNPYAVAIARFRLTLAYMAKAGVTSLREVPRLPLNLVVADSLLHGARGQRRLAEVAEDRGGWHDELFTLDDEEQAKKVLEQGYHVVVGNPPYITCKDATLREVYRESYRSCFREYALAAPFAERFFQLCVGGGFTAFITANSFAKREFGSRLIEEVLATLDVTHLFDTSRAYIPGHGTPTIIICGRNQEPQTDSIWAALGKRGEPSPPTIPSQGLVWTSLTSHLGQADFDDEFATTGQVPRERFGRHPWCLAGGGACELREELSSRAGMKLGQVVEPIGFGVITGDDDAFITTSAAGQRSGLQARHLRAMVTGDAVRDWAISTDEMTVWPCADDGTVLSESEVADVLRYFWPYRSALADRKAFGRALSARGVPWYGLRELYRDRLETPMSMAFAFVSTHNNFVFAPDGKLFNRSAPMIKLHAAAGEKDYLSLLGYLNSSAAGFWMKLTFHDKGSGTDSGKWQADPAKIAYEFTATGMESLPVLGPRLPPRVAELAAECHLLATLREGLPEAVTPRALGGGPSIQEQLRRAEEEDRQLLCRAIGIQEEIDWLVYRALGLTTLPPLDTPNEVALGERPFEILMARNGVRIGTDGQSLVGVVPERWGAPQRDLWERRIGEIEQTKAIRLIESPVYKRRWVVTPKNLAGRVLTFADRARVRLRELLLDRMEAISKRNASPVTLGRLLAVLQLDADFSGLVAAYADPESDPAEVARTLLREESVPWLARMRLTDSGYVKFRAWERCWELQRRQDAGEGVRIDEPPRYKEKDYEAEASWRLRGKLDVPKERFISYPGAERDGEGLLIGWAGWDHLQRAQALAALYTERRHTDGWPKEKLTPLLAGLLELVPWLKQWHDEPSPEHDGARLGTYFEGFVQTEARELGLTVEDLRAWRPPAPTRGRRGRMPAPTEEP